MNDTSQSRLASVLTLFAGAWLLLSPIWISMTDAALTNILISGAVIALAGAVQFFWTNPLPSWISGLAGAWLVVSGFIFTMSDAAVWSMIITALVTVALALWDGVEVSHVQERHGHLQT